jgi:hypothetical protein
MNLSKISIRDSLFSHAFSSSNWFKPTFFEWDFKNTDGNIIFLTDRNVHEHHLFPNKKKYAWLVESPAITPDSYNYVYENYEKYDKIFSHSKRILQFPNSYFLPIGGCHLNEDQISLQEEKNKLISMIFSFKNFSTGHRMRFDIFNKFNNLIDCMGSGIDGKHLPKFYSCDQYCFSIVIENHKEDFYFTEKIVDCFLTGTIPIYWGCPSIKTIFNGNGFFTFDTIEELENIISDKNKLLKFREKNKNAIQDNFKIAQKYKIAEDYLYSNYNEFLK